MIPRERGRDVGVPNASLRVPNQQKPDTRRGIWPENPPRQYYHPPTLRTAAPCHALPVQVAPHVFFRARTGPSLIRMPAREAPHFPVVSSCHFLRRVGGPTRYWVAFILVLLDEQSAGKNRDGMDGWCLRKKIPSRVSSPVTLLQAVEEKGEGSMRLSFHPCTEFFFSFSAVKASSWAINLSHELSR